MNYEQKKVNLDNQCNACYIVKKSISKGITNINDIIKEIKQLNIEGNKYKEDIVKFLNFLEDLSNEKYGQQRNNHNFMKTFLKEKIETYNRIEYHHLENSLAKGKVPYADNVAPKKIMSNYFLSNHNEILLDTDNLETAFRKFTRSERFFLSSEKISNFNLDNQEEVINQNMFKTHEKKKSKDEIDNIRKYFALQLTRREYFLYDILKKCFPDKNNFESLDLLDYLYCKYIYNESLMENYNNWLEGIGSNVKIYQVEYKNCLLDISYEKAKELETTLTEKDYADSNLAITEVHTFILSDFLNLEDPTGLNMSLKNNGISEFFPEEIDMIKHILVTVGSGTKLCFLFTNGIEPNKSFFNKLNFMIHNFWDEFMIHQVLLNLLLNKKSKLNNVEYFKKANIKKEVLNRAKFMYSAFEKSKEFEEKIKKPKTKVLN